MHNNYVYKETTLSGTMKHADFAAEKIFAIYEEPVNHMDILSANGTLQRSCQFEECLLNYGLKLIRLKFIQIPILKWSTRPLSL